MADSPPPPHDAPLDRAATMLDTGLEHEAPRQHGPEVGDRFGHYHVVRQLGAGAMGTVVEAYDETLDRRVAIKVLHERQSNRQERRLLREAQALARLSHSNVVQVYEVGEAAQHLFIAMELVVGQTLDHWHAQPRPWREVVEAYVQAGRGLAAAHAEGLIHRDFKPSNCIIDDHGRVKVLDFGLARESGSIESDMTVSVTNREQVLQDLASSVGTDSKALSEVLTRTGSLLGTPAYMAPEQLMGQGADAASDQFNFCVSLYEALYRGRPFPHDSIGELLNAVMGDEPPRLPGPRSGVPRAIWPVLRRGLGHDPKARWPSMDALLQRLDRVLHRRPHRRWLTLAGLAAATTGGVLWGQADGTPPCRGAEARMATVWYPARAQRVGDTLLATGVPYAEATRDRVLAGLQTYTEAWVGSHTAACEATSVHQQQSAEVLDLRMRCLEQRRSALTRTVELLEASDRVVAENAVAMIGALPAVVGCDDLVALKAKLPPADDPATAAEVEAHRDQLARARALNEAGRSEDGHAVIVPVVERAQALGYAPLQVEADLALGHALHDLGRYPEAQARLVDAYDLAMEIGYDTLAARAAQQLTDVEGNARALRSVGRTWAITAEALARRVDPEGPQHANALRSTAIVQIGEGEVEQAAARFEHALRIAEAEPGSFALARALGDMGNLRAMQGQPAEALRLYERARTIKRSLLGEGHPALAVETSNIGRVYEQQNQLDQAVAEHEQALALWEAARGSEHPAVATALNNLAVAYDKQGKLPRAIDLYERALAIRERALGPEHPFIAQTLANLGAAWSTQGQHERALPYLQRALPIFERQGGGPFESTVWEVADTELRLGRLEDARANFERFSALVESHEDESSHLRALAEFSLARVQWAQGQEDAAQALARRALERAAAAGEPGRSLHRDISAWLAEPTVD